VRLIRGASGTLGISLKKYDSTVSWGPYEILGLAPHGAAEAGGQLKKGDLIHAVDGISIEKTHLSHVVGLLRGTPGSATILAISRSPAHAVATLPPPLQRPLHPQQQHMGQSTLLTQPAVLPFSASSPPQVCGWVAVCVCVCVCV
jgi:hypothetical protein